MLGSKTFLRNENFSRNCTTSNKVIIYIIFIYFQHFYLRQKISPLKIICISDIIKKEPWSLFPTFWSCLFFLSFQKQIQCCSWRKWWFWEIKTMTWNSFCSRVTFLNYQFNCPEEMVLVKSYGFCDPIEDFLKNLLSKIY